MFDRLLDSIDVSQLMTRIVEFVPQLVVALAILFAAWVFYRATRPALVKVFERANFQDALITLLVHNIYRYALAIVAAIMALGQLGVNVAAALAGVGIAGVALGFAAQDSVANVISGIMIFWDKPFIVGDWIKAEGQYGQVVEITLRSTRIRTVRNTFVVIPNKQIIDAVLENFSKRGEMRVDVPIGIAYKETIAEAREVILRAVDGLEGIRPDPPPAVVAEGLGDSSVNLQVRVWIDDGRQLQPVEFRVVEAAKVALDAAGIEIPFPHLQLFLENVEERVWKRAAALRAGD